MMNNLFSSFDPISFNNFSFNWISIILSILILKNNFFLSNSRFFIMFNLIKLNMMKEILIITKNKKTSIFFLLMFFCVIVMNLFGLLPYVFTPSSHLCITLSMALPIWISLMILGWFFNTNHMFAHLLPLGTPKLLMMFMVIIESVSNFIRPITLSVRLMANMTAGHLMITLLSNMFYSFSNSIVFFIILLMNIMLLLLEIAVAMIQSYVIVILSALYTSEV